MSRNFDVENLLIAEYATQDFQNRGVLGSIFPGVINFEQRPQVWPQFYMVITIRPKTGNFKFSFYFSGPKRENIATFQAFYRNERSPDKRERIIFNSQIPPVNFAGPGIYYLGILDAEKKVVERDYVVEVGATLPLQLGQIEMASAPITGDVS